MADYLSNPAWITAAASAIALLLRAIFDVLKNKYRQSVRGDRRKPDSNGHDNGHADLRLLIQTEAKATRAALEAHAEEDTRRFDFLMEDSKVLHARYHRDANVMTALVTKVELLIANRIKPK